MAGNRECSSGTSSVGADDMDLPESCIANILRLTTPKDVARLACVSRAFRDAACSDTVWQTMLPPRYTEVLAQVADAPPSSCSKKEVYDYLCNRVHLQSGTQDYWIDRSTGGVCQSVGARGLYIVWGGDERYWEWISREGSRFAEVAHLLQVCWFEVSGKLQTFLPPGTYVLSWRIHLVDTPRVNGRGYYHQVYRGHGWNQTPVKFHIETTDHHRQETELYLAAQGKIRHQLSQEQVRPEAWMEIDVGQFTIEAGDSTTGIEFSMVEIERGHWKSGLSLDCVMIRPSNVRQRDSAYEIGTTENSSSMDTNEEPLVADFYLEEDDDDSVLFV